MYIGSIKFGDFIKNPPIGQSFQLYGISIITGINSNLHVAYFEDLHFEN